MAYCCLIRALAAHRLYQCILLEAAAIKLKLIFINEPVSHLHVCTLFLYFCMYLNMLSSGMCVSYPQKQFYRGRVITVGLSIVLRFSKRHDVQLLQVRTNEKKPDLAHSLSGVFMTYCYSNVSF